MGDVVSKAVGYSRHIWTSDRFVSCNKFCLLNELVKCLQSLLILSALLKINGGLNLIDWTSIMTSRQTGAQLFFSCFLIKQTGFKCVWKTYLVSGPFC